jgi:hypothetical protein
MASRYTPAQSLIWIVVTVAFFGLIPLVHRLRSAHGGEKLPTSRFVIFFTLLVLGLLAINFFQPWLLSTLNHHRSTRDAIDRLVGVGGGWLLPLLMLAIFAAIMLVRRRRSH